LYSNRTFRAGTNHNRRVIVAINGVAKRVRVSVDGNFEQNVGDFSIIGGISVSNLMRRHGYGH
jgi:hypothetical protein